MSWKIEVVMDDSGQWEGDNRRFATEQEALTRAHDLEWRCAAVRERRIVWTTDPVNQSPCRRLPKSILERPDR